MYANRCILCRQPARTGLNILDCTICFSCEKKMLNNRIFPYRRRKLIRLYREL